MKTLLLLTFLIGANYSFSQNYFDGTVTFKLYDEGRQIRYNEFMANWKIIDDRNSVKMFMDDTVSMNGDYFELMLDKRNFIKYSDSTGSFSIHTGGGSPYFSFELARNSDTLCYFSFGATNFYTDSIPTNRKTYCHSPYDRNENPPGERIVLKIASKIGPSNLDYNNIEYFIKEESED